jgi:hypothetical protein
MSSSRNLGMGGPPRGRLLLSMRDARGALVERRARNIVLRQGAAIIAGLFSGASGATRIDSVRVGFSREAATPELTALTPPPGASIPASALQSAVDAADFTLVTDRAGSVQLLVSSVFKPTQELTDVTEAGLMAGERLYNQVVFEPVTLRPGQDVTFFWEIAFPFGH